MRAVSPRARASVWLTGLVTVAGTAAWLAFTRRVAFPVLSWSDEIVYAVMARNIADGRGLVTGFYDWRALLHGGYPQGDVHMPGHALFMSGFFAVFGSTEAVAFATAWAAVLGSAVLAYDAARHAFGVAAGARAALLLPLLPGVAGYAHTTMSEPTVLLVSSLFLWSWSRVSGTGTAMVLAVAVALAILCRESLLVFLLPAGEALLRLPPATRRRAGRAFGLTLAALLPFVAIAYAGRARYPHFLSELGPLGGELWRHGLMTRLRDNFALDRAATIDELLLPTLLGLVALLAAVAARRGCAHTRRVAWQTGLLTVATLLGLAALYPLRSWAAVRAFFFLAPWIALLFAGLTATARGALRHSVTAVAFALLAAQSLRTVTALAADRRAEQAANAEVATLFERLTTGVPLQTVLGYESPWEIGWRRHPVTIVWNVPAGVEHVRRVEQVLPLDAVIGRSPHVMPVAVAAARGELRYGYDLVRRGPEAQRQVLIRRGVAPSAR